MKRTHLLLILTLVFTPAVAEHLEDAPDDYDRYDALKRFDSVEEYCEQTVDMLTIIRNSRVKGISKVDATTLAYYDYHDAFVPKMIDSIWNAPIDKLLRQKRKHTRQDHIDICIEQMR